MTDTKQHSEGAIRAGLAISTLLNALKPHQSTNYLTLASIIDRETKCNKMERIGFTASELEKVKEVNRVLTKGLQEMTQMYSNLTWVQYATKVLEEAKALSLANNVKEN